QSGFHFFASHFLSAAANAPRLANSPFDGFGLTTAADTNSSQVGMRTSGAAGGPHASLSNRVNCSVFPGFRAAAGSRTFLGSCLRMSSAISRSGVALGNRALRSGGKPVDGHCRGAPSRPVLPTTMRSVRSGYVLADAEDGGTPPAAGMYEPPQ